MSLETIEYLNKNTLIGFTESRGYFWHYDESFFQDGTLNNHYPHAIPMADVVKRLFHWDAVEVPVTFELNNITHTAQGRKGIVHSDTGKFFYMASNRYVVHQYREWLLETPAKILDASHGDLQIGSAGQLQDGARAWVQLEVPEGVMVGGVDRLVPFIIATTAHNGRGATEYKAGFNRVGCDNTLAAFMAERSPSYRIPHRRNAKLSISEARRILEVAFIGLEVEMAEITKLIESPISDDQFRKLVVAAVPYKSDTKNATTIAEKMRARLVDLWETSPMILDIRGTAWGALQVFNTYAQHDGRTRGVVMPEKVKLDFLAGRTADTDNNVLETMKALELVK